VVYTPPTVSDTHHNTSDADNIVPDVHHGVPNTRILASDIHRNKLNSREDVGGQKQAVRIPHTLTVTEYPLTTAPRLTPGQWSRLQRVQCLISAFSAPGESPPPLPRNAPGTIPSTRRDVSEVHRDVANTQNMVSDIRNMLKGQEGSGGQPQPVSVARTLSLTEHTLIVSQTQNRSAF
jgi:hypothetical protein